MIKRIYYPEIWGEFDVSLSEQGKKLQSKSHVRTRGLYICIQMLRSIHSVYTYKYTDMYPDGNVTGIRGLAGKSTTTSWLYRSQKCNPLAHHGHLGLAHTLPVTPLDAETVQDRKPPPHIPSTSLHGPALRTPFLGSDKGNSFQPRGYFESAS